MVKTLALAWRETVGDPHGNVALEESGKLSQEARRRNVASVDGVGERDIGDSSPKKDGPGWKGAGAVPRSQEAAP